MQGFGNKYYHFSSRIKGWVHDIPWQLGMGRDAITKARGSRVMVYHGICIKDHLRYNTLFITLRAFEKQIQLYKKYCTIISLDDHYRQKFDNDKFNLSLSFDDGLANNYKYVLPILEKYEVPATFFITAIRETGQDILWNDVLSMAYRHGPQKIKSGNENFEKRKDGKYISSAGQLLADKLRQTGYDEKEKMIISLRKYKQKADPDFWLQMTEEQIKQLSASKWVTIGSHGYYHNDLAFLSQDKTGEEMQRSKKYLENITGKEIRSIAFPYGSYNKETIQEAKKAGYSQLLATDFLFDSDNNDTTMKERFTINPFISSVNQLRANSNGKY